MVPLDIGRMDVECPHCHALHWGEERMLSSIGVHRPEFEMCCNMRIFPLRRFAIFKMSCACTIDTVTYINMQTTPYNLFLSILPTSLTLPNANNPETLRSQPPKAALHLLEPVSTTKLRKTPPNITSTPRMILKTLIKTTLPPKKAHKQRRKH